MSERSVLVTGGARGIGKGIAKSFLEAGHRVMIADLGVANDWKYRSSSDADLRDTIEELGGIGNIEATHLDVSDEESCNSAVQATIEAFGQLDVLVNNAGVVDSGSTDEFTKDQWERLFSVNVTGVFLMTRAAVGDLRRSADAAIVNLASIAGKSGAPRMAAYCGSKFAVVGMTQSFAREFASDGVRVNALCPGMVGTAMWQDHLMANASGETFEDRMQSIIPLGRSQSTEDMGEAAVYLASAKNVSGIALNVAGGYEVH